VFEEVKIQKPVFVEETIKLPVGFDDVANKIAEKLSSLIYAKVERAIEDGLHRVVQSRLQPVEVPIIKEVVTVKEVEVERPIFKDVVVERPVYKDREIINPVKIDIPVTNAVIVDKNVTNAIIEDVKVQNAIITDVQVERIILQDKIVEVIHKQCVDEKGNHLK